MNLYKLTLFIITAVFSFTNCGKQSDEIKKEGGRVNPGYAEVICSVVEIDSKLDSDNPDVPCAKVPCYALVRIDSVLGYGASFGDPLVKGSVIRLKFMFTVERTGEELFPNLEEHLPGVSENSIFSGDIQLVKGSPAYTDEEHPRLYRIFNYQLIE